MNYKLCTVIALCMLMSTLAMAREYNEHAFCWRATGIENTTIAFKGEGRETMSGKAWKHAVAEIHQMAKDGKIPDMTPLRVDLVWRGRRFVRVVYARKGGEPFDPMPREGGYWYYDPADGKIKWQKKRSR